MTPARFLSTALAALLPALLAAGCSDGPTTTELTPNAPNAHIGAAAAAADAGALAQLGKAIFFDTNLSINRNQSCAACHAPADGFKGPNAQVNAHGAVYEGSIPGRFGNRAPPSAAYATPAPVFHLSRHAGGVLVGGNFWDGRATGSDLGSPAAEQARGPFLNPAEQALPDLACVVYRVSVASYAASFVAAWGGAISTIAFPTDVESLCAQEGQTVPLSVADRATARTVYNQIAFSIAGFEASPEVNAYSSKFDASRRGMAKLTPQEQRGLVLFQTKGGCAACHPSRGQQALFTDFSYDNLGVPANPENPVYSYNPAFVDLGLGGPGGAAPGEDQWGMMKVPTLRNVDRGAVTTSKAYTHNGVFKSLKEVVHFYNTRDVLPVCATGAPRTTWGVTCWPAPEVAEDVNHDELGDLGLTSEEEDAIVAFLQTLSDGWTGPRH